jgi:hypothetical protein
VIWTFFSNSHNLTPIITAVNSPTLINSFLLFFGDDFFCEALVQVRMQVQLVQLVFFFHQINLQDCDVEVFAFEGFKLFSILLFECFFGELVFVVV